MVGVFLANKPNVASYWGVLAMVIALVFQVHYRPYESNTLNNLEVLSIGTTIVTQFGSILYVG